MARILLIEDDSDLSELLIDFLTFQKHQVEALLSGKNAVCRLESNSFDLAIIDWDLPEKSGIEIVSEYRKNGGVIPVLMLTGRGKMADKTAGFQAGADDYLTKPFGIEELSMRIGALLRRADQYSKKDVDEGEKFREVKLCVVCQKEYTDNETICPDDKAKLMVLRAEPCIGSTLAGRYEILSLVGQGGMSAVYQGRHKFINRNVAIKLLHSVLLKEEAKSQRFLKEAQTASLLDHRNIVRVYDFGIASGGQPYLVMDLVDGLDLSALLEEKKRLPVSQAQDILLQACSGMAHAHEKGVIHRDIKPTNIMIESAGDNEGVVKIVDFGIAKTLPGKGAYQQRLTNPGELFGSLHYMSPEQSAGEVVDFRSDIYSLGCVIYELITGQPPIQGKNQFETLQMQIMNDALPMRQTAPDLDIDCDLDKIVLKALEKNPDARWQSMDEFASQIRAICV